MFVHLSFIKGFAVVVMYWDDDVVRKFRVLEFDVTSFGGNLHTSDMHQDFLNVFISKRFRVLIELFKQILQPAHVAT